MDETTAHQTLQGVSIASSLQVNPTTNFHLRGLSPLRPGKVGAQILRHLLV